jgi:cytochrome c peroxidase
MRRLSFRKPIMSKVLTTFLVGAGTLFLLSQVSSSDTAVLPNNFPFPNVSGVLETNNVNGNIDLTNPFFKSIGTNGRACVSCHLPDEGWSISAERTQLRFDATGGLDPIFRTNDGSNCNHNIDVSTLDARRHAYSLVTSRGLIRIALTVPANAEFEVVDVNNPYGCNEKDILSFYRRPLPATNLRFISGVMWDGRESSTQTGTQPISYATNPGDLLSDLAHQSVDATLGHAQAAIAPTPQQQEQIVNLEIGFSTAQSFDYNAGPLFTEGGQGGPKILATQQFFIGINDPLGQNPRGTPFTPVVFTLFTAWSNLHGNGKPQLAKASIARGEAIFNSKPITITDVAGLNDDLGISSIKGTCGTCHDTPNVGNHSFPAPLNIGVGDPDGPGRTSLDISYLPTITLRNKSTGDIKRTTDVGRAMITGKWKHIGRLKGPILRGLASRAPYFHNGSAKTLADAVDFYDKRFGIGFTAQERVDLVAFLNAL